MRKGRKIGLVFRSVRQFLFPQSSSCHLGGCPQLRGPFVPSWVGAGAGAGRGPWPLPRAWAGAWNSGQRPAPGALGVGWGGDGSKGRSSESPHSEVLPTPGPSSGEPLTRTVPGPPRAPCYTETVLLAGHPQGCTLPFPGPGLGDPVKSWPLFPGRIEAAFREQVGLEAQQPGPSRTLTRCVTQASPLASLSSSPFICEKGLNNPTS